MAANNTGSASTLLAGGATYYVATNGNNGNPGTIGQPWRTISYAVGRVNPGDTIYVRGGTYSESVTISRTGAKKSPITLAAYNGEAVTINGGGRQAIYTDGRGKDYWVIKGLTLRSTNMYTLQMSTWGGCFSSTSCTGAKYWTIRNNTIYGAVFLIGSYNQFLSNNIDGSDHTGDENAVLEAGINSHHNTYRNNEVHHFSHRGFWSESYTHNGLWVGNYVHDITSNGVTQAIDMDGYKNVEWGHKILNNRVERVSGLGIQLENTFASRVENNVVISSSLQGIVVINYGYPNCEKVGNYGGSDCVGMNTKTILRQNLIYGGASQGGIISFGAGGIQILGNTIANTGGPSIFLSGQNQTPKITLRNNILSGGRFGIQMDTMSSLVSDKFNLFYPKGAAYWVGGHQYSVTQYQAATQRAQKSIQMNPLFVNPATGNFHLQKNSPAINKGTSFGSKKDLDGTKRPQDRKYDIGAYEYKP